MTIFKHNFKGLTGIVLGLIITLFLVACGGQDMQTDPEEVDNPSSGNENIVAPIFTDMSEVDYVIGLFKYLQSVDVIETLSLTDVMTEDASDSAILFTDSSNGRVGVWLSNYEAMYQYYYLYESEMIEYTNPMLLYSESDVTHALSDDAYNEKMQAAYELVDNRFFKIKSDYLIDIESNQYLKPVPTSDQLLNIEVIEDNFITGELSNDYLESSDLYSRYLELLGDHGTMQITFDVDITEESISFYQEFELNNGADMNEIGIIAEQENAIAFDVVRESEIELPTENELEKISQEEFNDILIEVDLPPLED